MHADAHTDTYANGRCQTNAERTPFSVWADATSKCVQMLDVCSRIFGMYYTYVYTELYDPYAHTRFIIHKNQINAQHIHVILDRQLLTLKTYLPSALRTQNLYSRLFLDLSSPTESPLQISRLLRCCVCMYMCGQGLLYTCSSRFERNS